MPKYASIARDREGNPIDKVDDIPIDLVSQTTSSKNWHRLG